MIPSAIALHGPQSPGRPLHHLLPEHIDDTSHWWFHNSHIHDWAEDHTITGRDFPVIRGHPSHRRAGWRHTKRCRRRARMVVVKEGRDIKWAEALKDYIRLGVKGLGLRTRGFTLGDLPGLTDEIAKWGVAPKVGRARIA